MEKLKFLLIIPFLMLSHSLAQVAADYYLPLQPGNALTYRSTGWEPRTVYESIEGADSINGQLYFIQVGKEVMDNAPLDTQVFHSFWLREATSGNIMIIAVGLGESTLLDSAMVYETPYTFFSNEHLISGSYWGSLYEGTYYQDSIMSVTETVNTEVGTFTNCIKMRRIRIDSLGATIWL
ncbi:MAG: hypothetical protein KAT38_14150, partial [Bacteroidales bacterium]|nr:hypothetical protein [Bacteroidales bacterium]